MDIAAAVASRAREKRHPDGTPYRGLSGPDVADLSRESGLPPRRIETAALRRDIVPDRYVRNMKFFDCRDQARLLDSRVAVVGLGGLGGGVVEILARLGVGTLHLIDGDAFDDTNLNRQFLSSPERVGRPKAEAAEQRVRSVNPSVDPVAFPEFLDARNAGRLLAGCDLVIDCLDNIHTRMVVERAAAAAGIPMVSAAVAGVSGHVTTVFPGDPGLRMLFGEPGTAPAKGAEATLGCLPQGVTLFSSLECSEAVKVLLGRGAPLRNRLLVVDLMENTFEVLDLGGGT